jgi:transcriptional regulator with XRE-family HTH domain
MENYGVIIRHLRNLAELDVRAAALKIGKSTGWLSEIENNRGKSRLTEIEFQNIVERLGGTRHRSMFKIWVANQKNRERACTTFEGAVLKHIRTKKKLSLQESAQLCSLSFGYLSKIECGLKPVTLEMRNRILTAYGYSPSSWKNLATDPIRSKAVPRSYKLEILLNQLSEEQIAEIFDFALKTQQTHNRKETI